MATLRVRDFDVDLVKREVIHRPSGIRFSFYEYRTEDDWLSSSSTIFSDNAEWSGDRGALAAEAKKAAINAGMKAKRPNLAVLDG